MVARPVGSRSRLRLLFLGAIVVILAATIVALVVVAPLGQMDISSINSANQAEEACEGEYQAVQTGLRYYMSEYQVITVPAAASTNNMWSPVPMFNVGMPRNTIWAYTWDSKGRVTGISQIGDGPYIPAGCVVSG
jgi:hypothetical protein